MSTGKTQSYQCTQCHATLSKWQGRCFQCGAWDSIEAIISREKDQGYAASSAAEVVQLSSIQPQDTPRMDTGWHELNRVLGGGLVPGSVLLLGGDPGVGKSTLLLQMLCRLSKSTSTLYVSGEESPQQIALRAQRMQVSLDTSYLLTHTDVAVIIATIKAQKARLVIIDSIQTMASSEVSAAAGSVSQVRECALRLTQMAKHEHITVWLIGHMTKDGHVAGPRVLEHMVDSVLYLEGEQSGRYRMLRASKNRFGAVHELGVFAMMAEGLREVKNPSLLFLSSEKRSASGSVITTCWEGSRALLVELQSLVEDSYSQSPRRVVMGVDSTRITMLLAILSKHAGISCHNQDVFINVVGGLRITETAADLALVAAVMSSRAARALPRDVLVMGELGLNGEVRPVQQGEARVAQAVKHGIRRIILPASNQVKDSTGCQLYPVASVGHMRSLLAQWLEQPVVEK